MEQNEMLDNIFGSPAPQTFYGKFENYKNGIYVLGGFIIISVFIGIAIKKSRKKTKPKEKTT